MRSLLNVPGVRHLGAHEMSVGCRRYGQGHCCPRAPSPDECGRFSIPTHGQYYHRNWEVRCIEFNEAVVS
jgi:hypothetical protein